MDINLDRHVWEGWTVKDFIENLDLSLKIIQNNDSWHKKIENKKELKKFCMQNQPHYKKHIPEVVQYFSEKYSIKN